MKRSSLIALALALGCGLPPQSDEPPHARAAIIGGDLTDTLPAVVLLISYPQDRSTFKTCTASVVAPKVLLTAAHCIDAPSHAGETFGVFTGADASSYPTAATLVPHLTPVKALHVHPSYVASPPFTADIGVVELDAELAAAPLKVSLKPLDASFVGQAARIAGYGQRMYQQFNARRAVATTGIAAVGTDTVQVGDSTHKSCIGDSGGPALVTMQGEERIIGVDSYTDLSGCLEPAHYRRTDVYADFLRQHVPGLTAPVMDAGTGGGGEGPEPRGCSTAPGLSAWALALCAALRAGRRR